MIHRPFLRSAIQVVGDTIIESSENNVNDAGKHIIDTLYSQSNKPQNSKSVE